MNLTDESCRLLPSHQKYQGRDNLPLLLFNSSGKSLSNRFHLVGTQFISHFFCYLYPRQPFCVPTIERLASSFKALSDNTTPFSQLEAVLFDILRRLAIDGTPIPCLRSNIASFFVSDV